MDKTAAFQAKTEDLENFGLVRKGDILTLKLWCSNSSASDSKKLVDMIKTSGSERTQNSKKQKVNHLQNRRNGLDELK